MHELIFIEIEQFSKKLDKVSDVSFMIELQNELLRDPEKGDVIKGTAGARKIRMAATGRGKRGGSRVIYYYVDLRGEIWFLDIYQKSDQENISPVDKKWLKAVIEEIDNV